MGHSSTRAALINQHASRDRERAIAAAVPARFEAARPKAEGHHRRTATGKARNATPGQKRRKRPAAGAPGAGDEDRTRILSLGS